MSNRAKHDGQQKPLPFREPTEVIERTKDGSGNWYWCLKIDGETYAEGEEESRGDAAYRLHLNREEWKAANGIK